DGGHRPCLAAEAFGEAGLLDQRRQQDLDRHGPAEHLVGAAPHVAHAAAGDPLVEAVALAEQHPGAQHAHLPPPVTARITCPAMRVASALPPLPARSRKTATAATGSSPFITNPMNQPWSGDSPVSAVPVLPPTV